MSEDRKDRPTIKEAMEDAARQRKQARGKYPSNPMQQQEDSERRIRSDKNQKPQW